HVGAALFDASLRGAAAGAAHQGRAGRSASAGSLQLRLASHRSGLMSIEFLITTLIVVVSPGTGVLYTLAAGLSRGSRASVVAAFGCPLGIVPHMAAAILGLAALLHTSALAFETLKWLGVAYLLYMAWNALKEHGALKIEKEVGARSDLGVI